MKRAGKFKIYKGDKKILENQKLKIRNKKTVHKILVDKKHYGKR